ncbi:MAG: LUD domain-containing protein [Peptococcaceae bacterium]|nr:LUD domain-containing protein [Peptococcaceae bacterium]
MSTDRKTFMARVSRALGNDRVPDQITPSYDYSQGRQYSRLQNLDAAALREVMAAQAPVRDFTYYECNADELPALLAEIIAKEAPNRVVVPADTAADGIDLAALVATSGAEVYGYSKDADAASQRATIESADLGITIPFRAIADTGTTLEIASDSCGKIVGLLPTAHISIIFQSRMRATLTQLAPELDELGAAADGPSYFLFISGPSSTGDIESVLVTGVHGPTREYDIVVKDL